jgi:hypothetical protein
VSVLTAESFSPHVNSTFVLVIGEGGMDLTLTELSRQPIRPFPGMIREPFSLIFRSASQVVLPQRIYPFRHAAMGRLELFIVPIGRDAAGVVYQAVFN